MCLPFWFVFTNEPHECRDVFVAFLWTHYCSAGKSVQLFATLLNVFLLGINWSYRANISSFLEWLINSCSHQSSLLLYHVAGTFFICFLLFPCPSVLLSCFLNSLNSARGFVSSVAPAWSKYKPKGSSRVVFLLFPDGNQAQALFIFPQTGFLSVFIHTFKMSHIVTFCIVEPPWRRWPFPEFEFGNARVLKANIFIYFKYLLLLPAVPAGKSIVCIADKV